MSSQEFESMESVLECYIVFLQFMQETLSFIQRNIFSILYLIEMVLMILL